MSEAPIVECVHAGRCPGCALIRLGYGAQLAAKRQTLERAVRRHPTLERVSIDEPIGSDAITDYRVRAKLAVALDPVRIGAFSGAQHEIIDIPHCRVLTPPIARSVDALRRLLAAPPDAIAALARALTAVDLRAASTPSGARVLLTAVIDRERAGTAEEQRVFGEHVLARRPEVSGVALSMGAARGPQQLGSKPRTIAGCSELVDRTEGAELIAMPGAFVQVHRDQAERIVRELADGLTRVLGSLEGARMLDLYAGSGAIGLSLAARGADLTLVESYRPAADAARRAAARFGDRVHVVCDDAARYLTIAAHDWQAVIVNPPRRGITPAVRARLASLGPRIVAYISCNPETLARDLAQLALLGLGAQRVVPLDMMPLTEEVETLALLEPSPPPRPRVIYEDDELVVVDKPAHEPMESLALRVRELPECGDACALWRLGSATSGVCVFAKTRQARDRRARSMPRPRAHWIVLTRGKAKLRAEAMARQRRFELVAGHSLLEIETTLSEQRLTRWLAWIGFPVVGDARTGHPPTNRHFGERYGLDRAFLHCARFEIAIDSACVFEAPLAGDLAAVVEAAAGRIRPSAQTPRSADMPASAQIPNRS